MYEYIIVTNPDRSRGLKTLFLERVKTQAGFEDKKSYVLPKGLEVQTLEEAKVRASKHLKCRRYPQIAFAFLLDNGDFFYFKLLDEQEVTNNPHPPNNSEHKAHDPIVSSPVKKG